MLEVSVISYLDNCQCYDIGDYLTNSWRPSRRDNLRVLTGISIVSIPHFVFRLSIIVNGCKYCKNMLAIAATPLSILRTILTLFETIQ